MRTQRSDQLEREIRELESQLQYNSSMIGYLISEANLIDMEIQTWTQSAIVLRAQLKDKRAEYKDTI